MGSFCRLLASRTAMTCRLFRQTVALPPPTSRLFHFGSDQWTETTVKEIEATWSSKVKEEMSTVTPYLGDEKPFYVLSMFPYPSGHLHMGHVKVYALSDALATYHRMKGRAVIHPMGWDAFGLPAENAAIERKINPKVWTKDNIASMKHQLNKLGCYFDWDREIATCDPAYYRWTQFLFLKLLDAGLAYRHDAVVNWDPVDKTVLADEQVDSSGRSWRSGAKVEKRPLRQWFLRTTNFSKDLHDDLDDPSLVNWRDITEVQRNWIGTCDGTRLRFPLSCGNDTYVWTDRPELIFGAGFIGISSEHVLNKESLVTKEHHCKTLDCTVKQLSTTAVNVFNNAQLQIFVFEKSDHFPDQSDSYIGIPATCERDQKIMADLGLEVVESVLSSDMRLQNSGQFTGMNLKQGREAVLKFAQEQKIGGHLTSSKLKDWLISRQRYWGTPIPVIHCSTCGAVPVPEDELPVVLPDLDTVSGSGGSGSPLEQVQEWVCVPCPKCGSADAKRETDTMDTFVDSSWYFLRYLDPRNSSAPVSLEVSKSMPVDIYIGGKEHATLHMYFARFITHFLHQIGLSPVKEPFRRLIVQGIVKGKSYRVKGSGKYLRPDEIDFSTPDPVEKSTGQRLVVEWEKMSKSKHNGVDPNELLERFGCDTTRLMTLCDGAPASERNWSEENYPRIRNMQVRLLKLVSLAGTLQNETLPALSEEKIKEEKLKLWDARNYYLKSANYSYSHSHNLRTMISRVQSLLQDLWTTPGQIKRDTAEFQRGLATAIILLAPISPHFSAELWRGLASVEVKHCQEFNWEKSVFHQRWPELDDSYNLQLIVKNGGDDFIEIPVARWKFATLSHEEAFDLACHDPKVQSEILPLDFSHSFERCDDLEATLTFSIAESEASIAEKRKRKAEMKEELKQEKLVKQQKREERILARKKAEERKLVQEVTKRG